MNGGKTFRHGQILRIVADTRVTNQGELRRRLAAQKLRVTQATLSRDLQELRLVKTHEGYKREAALPEETNGRGALTRALGEYLSDIRPAENMLVLKTPPGAAQPLAAAVDGAKFGEIAGTIAGDDTVLIITPDKKTREALQRQIESLVRPVSHLSKNPYQEDGKKICGNTSEAAGRIDEEVIIFQSRSDPAAGGRDLGLTPSAWLVRDRCGH